MFSWKAACQAKQWMVLAAARTSEVSLMRASEAFAEAVRMSLNLRPRAICMNEESRQMPVNMHHLGF